MTAENLSKEDSAAAEVATAKTVTRVIETETVASVTDVSVTSTDDRLYSDVVTVEATVDGQTRQYVAKRWRDDGTCRAQMRELAIARDLFESDEQVCVPYVGFSAKARLLVMEHVPDASLDRLAQFRPRRDHLACVAWRRRLVNACYNAGQWLRRWHEHEEGEAAIDRLLGDYLEARPAFLAAITCAQRRRLMTLVGSLGRAPVARVHGDYTPWNVLWSPDRTTVLDIGTNEWPKMTGAWDYETMRIGLSTELLFATRSPARWFSRLAAEPIRAFDRGYGTCVSQTADLSRACAITRHLVLYVADRDAGGSLRRRAAWHRRRIDELLAAA